MTPIELNQTDRNFVAYVLKQYCQNTPGLIKDDIEDIMDLASKFKDNIKTR